MLIDPPGDGFLRREIGRDREPRTVDGFEHGIADFMRCRIVEKDGDEIEVDGVAEFIREDVEQLRRVAMGANCPRHSG